LNCIKFLTVINELFFKHDKLAIQILLNVLVILQKSLICLVTNLGHLLLMVVHHLFKVLLEFAVSFIEGNLDSLLKSSIFHGYLILKILNLLRHRSFNRLELLSEQLRSIFRVVLNLVDTMSNQIKGCLDFIILVFFFGVAVSFEFSHLIKIKFILLLDISNLVVNVFFKS